MINVVKNNKSLLIKLLQSDWSEKVNFHWVGTALRISVGLLMLHNGLTKLADVQGFADNVVSFIGLPYPVFSTYCAAYIELIGAFLLSLGFLTRLNAIALLLVMLVAIYFHLLHDGFKVAPLEAASLYALCFLFFTINGGGKFSIDTLLVKWLAKDVEQSN